MREARIMKKFIFTVSVLLILVFFSIVRISTQGESPADDYYKAGEDAIEDEVYDDAYGYYKVAIEMFEKSGVKNENWAKAYMRLGDIDFGKYMKFKQAIEKYEKALQIANGILDAKNQENKKKIKAECYHNIASVYNKLGQYKEALENYYKALEIRKKLKAKDNQALLANSYNSIASVYTRQGRYKDALANYEKALDINEDIYKENHLNIAASYNNMGSVYYAEGKYKKALRNYKKALIISKKNIEIAPAYVANTFNNIGAVYFEQRKYKEALENYFK